MADHRDIFRGGVYAIETTYNRAEKSWHVHAHALVDNAKFALPKADQRVHFSGRNMRAFDLIKLALEYDWTCLWCPSLPKKSRANASEMVINGKRFEFERWVNLCYENRLKVYRAGGWKPITWLPEEEMERRRAWNLANRRVFWIKPVDDRNKACKEVLKYITKCSDFCDDPRCVREFHDAVKSTRLIQCFGSWYGVDFSTAFDTAHLAADWKGPQCACGCNEWHRMGTFFRRDVRMEADGCWYLRQPLDYNARGTIPRPRIRALAEPEPERTGD